MEYRRAAELVQRYSSFMFPNNVITENEVIAYLTQYGEADFDRKFDPSLFKDPKTMPVISFLVGLFGIDRFMLFEKHGVLKLLTLGGAGVWYWIDVFNAPKRARTYNVNIFTAAAQDFAKFQNAHANARKAQWEVAKTVASGAREIGRTFEAEPSPVSEPIINRNPVMFKDANNNWVSSEGGIFIDFKGNTCQVGGPFYDYRGNYCDGKPGSYFYDGRNNLVRVGDPFYDAAGNWIVP